MDQRDNDDPERGTAAPVAAPVGARGPAPATAGGGSRRSSPQQFLREVRSELRKVAWPSRRELLSYSVVVLVSVTLLTLYITALDTAFGALILEIFS